MFEPNLLMSSSWLCIWDMVDNDVVEPFNLCI